MSASHTRDRSLFLLTAALTAAASVCFVVFVYVYPAVFPLLEGAHPDNFEEGVNRAVAKGHLGNAARIARYAIEQSPLDPMVYTAYAQVLFEDGKPEEAAEQLREAVSLEHSPEHPQQVSREAFYFTPARLLLGEYFYGQGNLVKAATQFELARAGDDLQVDEYASSHPMLYETYADLGLWARALEYGQPAETELDETGAAGLLRIALIALGRSDWGLAEEAGSRLLNEATAESNARYVLGRARMALKDYEAAERHLRRASESHVPHAAFFLGLLFEKTGDPENAIVAYQQVTPADVYYPFAAAKAIALWRTLPEGRREALEPDIRRVQARIESTIAGLQEAPVPTTYAEYQRFKPLTVLPDRLHLQAGGSFPVLILWEDTRPRASTPQVFDTDTAADSGLRLSVRHGDFVLQLQWVENLVYWEGIEHLPPGTTGPPGWIDTARDWFRLRDYSVATVEQGSYGSYLAISGLTWFYSTPVPVGSTDGFALLGSIKSEPNMAGLGWQALDAGEAVLAEDSMTAVGPSGAWAWQAAYVPAQLHWHALRVTLDVARDAVAPRFDQIMLLPIVEPGPGWEGEKVDASLPPTAE